MTRRLRHLTLFSTLTALLATWACEGSDSRTVPAAAPSPATNPFTSMKVGTAGNIATPLVPGETRQLWAVATAADGNTSDVSNVAVWQSSDPSIASISTTGLLKAAIEGAVNVSATYQKVTGSMEVAVEKEQPKPPVGCSAVLDKPRLVYGAFGSSNTIAVTLTKSDCRWTAVSDAAWLRLSLTPNVSGSGTFQYQVLDNNTPSPRTGHVTLQVAEGPTTVHEVVQEKPLGCSYVVTPERARFTAAGGSGSFEVITTPGDCQWRLGVPSDFYPIRNVTPTSGTGRTTVSYTVISHSFTFELNPTITVNGLSGANPPGAHYITIAAR